jgi:putative membrane protein
MAGVLARTFVRGHAHHFGSGRWWWWLIALAVLVLLIWTIVALLTYRPATSEGRRTSPEPSRSSAEYVLADRLARGEIDADEYRRRRDTLRG